MKNDVSCVFVYLRPTIVHAFGHKISTFIETKTLRLFNILITFKHAVTYGYKLIIIDVRLERNLASIYLSLCQGTRAILVVLFYFRRLARQVHVLMSGGNGDLSQTSDVNCKFLFDKQHYWETLNFVESFGALVVVCLVENLNKFKKFGMKRA